MCVDFKMDTPWQVREVRLLLTPCPYKRLKSMARERGRRHGHISGFFFSAVFYMSWQHVAVWVTSCLERGFLIRLLGVCHLQPHALFFFFFFFVWSVHLCSVLLLFSFPCNTWESCWGKKNTASFPTHSSSKCLGTAAHCWHSFI